MKLMSPLQLILLLLLPLHLLPVLADGRAPIACLGLLEGLRCGFANSLSAQDQWRALIHRRYKLRFDDLPPSFV